MECSAYTVDNALDPKSGVQKADSIFNETYFWLFTQH